MKIVNLKTFRALPSGTIAMKYEPCVFGDLFSKGETWEHDFLLEYLTNEIDCLSSEAATNKLRLAEKENISVAMNFQMVTRDGMFEEDQLFAVWEKADIEGLIEKLTECLKMAYKD